MIAVLRTMRPAASGSAAGCGVRIKLADPGALSMNGKYIAEYDPAFPGMSEDGYPLICHLVVTPDPDRALHFADLRDALDFWKQAWGWRPDGQPNRPLTAFSVTFEGGDVPRTGRVSLPGRYA